MVQKTILVTTELIRVPGKIEKNPINYELLIERVFNYIG